MNSCALLSKCSLLFVCAIIVFSHSSMATETNSWWSLDGEVGVENPVSEPDHLVPDATEEDCGVFRIDLKTTRTINCLASFRANSRDHQYRWCLEEIDDNFQMTSFDSQFGTGSKKNKQRFMERTARLSQETGKLIQEIWVNTLLRVRYDSAGSTVLDGVRFSFTARVQTSGLSMGGQTWSPTGDLPPLWIVEVGQAIQDYVLSKDQEEGKLQDYLRKQRDKFILYYRNK